MRKDYKTVITERKEPVYYAEDGTEFSDEQQCIVHDINLLRERVVRRDDILWCEEANDFPPFNGGENSEFHNYHWCKPTSHEAVEALRSAFYPDYGDIDDDCIGKWCCLEEYDGDCFWSCITSDAAYVKRLCGLLGITVEFDEETENAIKIMEGEQ